MRIENSNVKVSRVRTSIHSLVCLLDPYQIRVYVIQTALAFHRASSRSTILLSLKCLFFVWNAMQLIWSLNYLLLGQSIGQSVGRISFMRRNRSMWHEWCQNDYRMKWFLFKRFYCIIFSLFVVVFVIICTTNLQLSLFFIKIFANESIKNAQPIKHAQCSIHRNQTFW